MTNIEFRTVFRAAVAGGLLLAASAAPTEARAAGARRADGFLGLWAGVDPLDGSPVRVSLTDVDGDGVLAFTMQEDFWSSCFDLGPTYSQGRGVVTGTATASAKGVLDATTGLTCISDANVPAPQGTSTVQYTLASRGRVLVLPPFGDAPAILLHKVAP